MNIDKTLLSNAILNYKNYFNQNHPISTEMMVIRGIILDNLDNTSHNESKIFELFQDKTACGHFLIDLAAQSYYEIINTNVAINRNTESFSIKKNNYSRAIDVLFPELDVFGLNDFHPIFHDLILEYINLSFNIKN